jgi:hypothetical protein
MHVCRLPRSGLACAQGGHGAFLINTGVLVTCVQTPFPPAVGFRRCVRIRVASDSFASGSDGGTTAAVRLVGAHAGPYTGGGAVAGCDDMRSISMPCFCLRHGAGFLLRHAFH